MGRRRYTADDVKKLERLVAAMTLEGMSQTDARQLARETIAALARKLDVIEDGEYPISRTRPGGLARAAALSPARRSEIARAAVNARHAKNRKGAARG